MAFIGKEPTVGNFQVCDAISVVNGQAAYTMQVSSTNVVPESANHMLVSLNGILQKPGSSFTVSGSTITFASNLATGDVIDFIMLLGNVLDIGTPSDSTVTNAKTNFTTTSSAAGLQIKGDGTTAGALQLNCEQNSHGIQLQSPPHSANQSYTLKFPSGNVTAGKFLKVDSVSGSGTTGIGTMTFADAGGGAYNLVSTTTVSSGTAQVDITSGIDSTYKAYRIYVINLHPSANSDLRLQVFHSGSAYTSSNYHYSGNGYRSNNNSLTSAGTSLEYFPIGNIQLGTSGAEHVSAIIDLYNPSETTFRKYMIAHIVGQDSSSRTFNYQMATTVQSDNAVDGVRFYMGSGNIDSATIKLYGVS
jgi:hypothetical protein